jgi:hypothetical protein
VLLANGIDSQNLHLPELLPLSQHLFGITQTEMIGLLSPNMDQEGIHDIRHLDVGLDYLVTLPHHDETELLDNIKTKLKAQINVR